MLRGRVLLARVAHPAAASRGRPVSAWLVAGATTVLALLSVRASVGTMRDGRPWVDLDLGVYLDGAHAVRDSGLYDLVLGPVHLPFTYPPFAAAAMWPLTALPFDLVSTAWLAASVLALAGLLWLAAPALRSPWRLALVAAVLVVAVWLEPVQSTLFYGQVNLLLALLVLADVAWPGRRPRWLPGGALVGLAAAVKLTPLLFVPYLYLVGRRTDAGRAVLTFGVCALLGGLVNPSASWQFWTSAVLDGQRVGDVDYLGNRALLGVWARATGVTPPTVLWLAVAVAVVVAGLLVAKVVTRVLGPVEGALVVAFTGLIAAPIAWAHHFVWAAPLLMVVLTRRMPVWLRGAGLLVVAGFAWQPVWFVLHDRADLDDVLTPGASYQAVGYSYAVAGALAIGWLLLLARLGGRYAPAPTSSGPTNSGPTSSGRPVSARATLDVTDASTSASDTSSAPQIAASSSLDASFWPRSTSDR